MLKNANNKGLTKDQVKYAEMGMDLEKMSSTLRQQTNFVNHLKKLARQCEQEYAEEMGETT